MGMKKLVMCIRCVRLSVMSTVLVELSRFSVRASTGPLLLGACHNLLYFPPPLFFFSTYRTNPNTYDQLLCIQAIHRQDGTSDIISRVSPWGLANVLTPSPSFVRGRLSLFPTQCLCMFYVFAYDIICIMQVLLLKVNSIVLSVSLGIMQ